MPLVRCKPISDDERSQRAQDLVWWQGDFHRSCLSAARGCHVYGLNVKEKYFGCFLCTSLILPARRTDGWKKSCPGWSDYRASKGFDVGPAVQGIVKLAGLNKVKKEMFSRTVPEEFHHSPVHIIEMLAFMVGARLWCETTYKGSRAVLESDNHAVVDVITDGQGKSKDYYLQAGARIIWNLNAVNGSSLAVRYINTKLNESDGLSRRKKREIESFLRQGFSMLHVGNDICNLDETY